ncbi:uncharacterized protein DUF2812 [Natranaerovirga pectinivora]|uniref:Uncharacterized protein DUF2812 n=1 Tax=Natranaerovirga pectinivora TaxID=682400 RepID=A0A4V2V0P5_9FIRM|nr:DUF2812 domain-containing protein [Natranaerovirga pectinivora]TCT17149.1 uncharacterized protein DUF2812 [Natranaerovirga pectinivora]
MYKYIYKIRPCDYWRIGENESWFSDMASKGLHLEGTGIHFAKFLKGEPKKMKYRIDISQPITLEEKELFAANGWDYVTHYKEFYIYASPEERDAPEFHTDSPEQSYTLESLNRKFLLNFVFGAIITILTIGFLYTVLNQKNIILSLVEEVFTLQYQLPLIILMLYSLYSSFQAVFSISRLRKMLRIGEPINHNAPWKKYVKRKKFRVILYCTVFISLFSIIPIAQIINSKSYPLPTGDTNLPIVRLIDLGEDVELIKERPDITDYFSVYSYDWSLLAPKQYHSQDIFSTSSNNLLGNKIYTIDTYVITKFYQLRFSSNSNLLLRDLIDKYGFADNNTEYIELDHLDFDYLYVYESEDHVKQVFAAKGKSVIYLRYRGKVDFESIIEVISLKI